ncbi:hypothetical protein [Photobacterium kishitanii]|uniref:Uncharacterized protein n=1 Tax=Photobacterium kishitanii TaxID=318456 RepID=A0A2T3KLZ6_9GAMM|nr:hypothetical protein [Photobacterium kishitanii]PSV00718.1 hypothetical protein C9J27_06135 [Photobacterium kishitanii]
MAQLKAHLSKSRTMVFLMHLSTIHTREYPKIIKGKVIVMWKVWKQGLWHKVYKKGLTKFSFLSPWGDYIELHRDEHGIYMSRYESVAQKVADKLNTAN